MEQIQTVLNKVVAFFRKTKEKVSSLWYKCVIEKNRKNKKINPIIFMNMPIERTKKDAIGIVAPVNAIRQAIKEGAKMIGVIAEYGAGKTSLTELLAKKHKSKVTRINLWDTLSEEHIGNPNEINHLTKAFIYQLAMGKSSYRAEHVNKILSNNYGVISFSTGFIRTWFFMIGAAICETIYQIGDGFAVETLNSFWKDTNPAWAHFVNDFSPIGRFCAILFVGFSILDASIVYSHWKTESRRVTDVGEVFAAYTYVHKCLRTLFIPRLIVIEDLDRIDDQEKVINFLKELYRYHNLCNTIFLKAPVFIISIAPESRLKVKENSKTASNAEMSYIYSKIFDYTVSLKPIHYDDYEVVLQDILDSEKDKKRKLNAILPEKEKMIDGKVSQAFAWIYKGDNLTLRDLKERLNDSIELYIELLNKNYEGSPAISFRTCVCVTYLEKKYGKDYYELIENEKLLNRIMQASHHWRNNSEITQKEQFVKEVEELCSNHYIAQDLADLIYSKILDMDYRMYFYSFPKGSYIKNADEKDICNYIEYPRDYTNYDYADVCEKVERLKGQNRLGKIHEAILRIVCTEEIEHFPKVILEQADLFQSAYAADEFMCRVALLNELTWSESGAEETIRVLRNVKTFLEEYDEALNDDIHSFWITFGSMLLGKYGKISDIASIISCRHILIKVFQQDVVWFKEMFKGKINETDFVPFITILEINEIADLETAFELMNEDNISREAYEGIKEIFGNSLSGKQKIKALAIHQYLYKKDTSPEVQEYLCEYMRVNKEIIDEFYFPICESIKQGKVSLEIFTRYINELDVQQLSELHLAPLNVMPLGMELKEEMVTALLKYGYYELPLKYYCYKQELEKVDFNNHPEVVVESCKEINKTNSELIFMIRSEIIRQRDGEICESYQKLFWNEYPLVLVEEMQQFDKFDVAMFMIDASKLEEENLQGYLDFINAEDRIGDDCYSVFENLFRPVSLNCTNVDVINLIINGLDYDKVKMMTMSEEQLKEVIGWLSSALKLTVADNVIEAMKLMKWILPEYEQLILNKKGSLEYVELINEINLCTEYTIEWITKLEPKYGFNTVITTRLKDHEYYKHYLVGRILYENKFDYPMNEELDDVLISLYRSDSPIINYLSQSDAYVEKLMKDKAYTNFQLSTNAKIIEPLYRVKQTYDFMKFMIENGSKQQIADYLKGLNEIETQEDSKKIAKLFIDNISYLEEEEVFNHVRFRLWENTDKARGYKGTLTQRRNEYLKQIGKG